MMIRTALSDKARAELVAFCADNLKPGLDPILYADGLESETDLSPEHVVFEIRGMNSKTGNPVTIGFSAAADFDGEEVE